ncbi:hypothetical protein BC834DRAFT_1030805 [Gloeopeniophorella convolvens]|nr:hypothetical protein BC834DRAFT_1030805 [Gloeopeniophorella convolvens]
MSATAPPRDSSGPRLSSLADVSGSVVRDGRSASANKLSDNVLLDIFDFYRLGYHRDRTVIHQKNWQRGNSGWRMLTHVCRRWRNVAFASPRRLDMKIFLTNGSRVEEILTTSPSLPILIDYAHLRTFTTDEDDMMYALQHRDRINSVSIHGSDSSLDRLFSSMDAPFPALEILNICPQGKLSIPNTFLAGSASHLLLLSMRNVSLPSLFRLLSSATNLVQLNLERIQETPYLMPGMLAIYLRSMPRLNRLVLDFLMSPRYSSGGNPGPVAFKQYMTVLPKLSIFHFLGDRMYLESLVSGLVAPYLEDLKVSLPSGPEFSIPHLAQFLSEVETPKYPAAQITFLGHAFYFGMRTYSQPVQQPPYRIRFSNFAEIGQFAVMIQVGASLHATLSVVEELSLGYFRRDFRSTWSTMTEIHAGPSSESPWNGFLQPFCGVKRLRVEGAMASPLARFLGENGGETPPDILPNLGEVELLFARGDNRHASALDPFTAFLGARQRAGRPVKVFCNTNYDNALSHWCI